MFDLNNIKNRATILTLLLVLLLIPGVILGVNLVRQRQELTSSAAIKNLAFTPGGCVVTKQNNLIANCPKVQFQLISPFRTDRKCSEPSPPVSCTKDVYYKFSESSSGLASAQEKLLTASPLSVCYIFANNSKGTKKIFVEFRDSSGEIKRENESIELIPDNSNQAPSPCEGALPPSPSPSQSQIASPSVVVSPTPSASVPALVSPSPSASVNASPSPSPSSLVCPASPSACPSGKVLINGDPSPGPNHCPIYSCVNLGNTDIIYRLAETEAGLSSATYYLFSQNPTFTIFTLSNDTPGTKQIWVEFKNNATGETRKEHITKELISNQPGVSPSPVQRAVRQAECSLDLGKTDVNVVLSGIGFGDAQGKVKSDQTELEIFEWNETQVRAILKKPNFSPGESKSFRLKLTRKDGVEVEGPGVCALDTSLVALGAKVFCRKPGNFDVSNVKITLRDQNSNSVEESVTITKDGLISGLKTKLQARKPYVLSIKAPNSLRRNSLFTAGSGTTLVTQQDGSPFILPIGDIAPSILPDGKINTLDRSEIVRQWSVFGNSQESTGDFNKDDRVNSIDWACMRYDFNKEDEAIPNFPVPSPTVTTSPSANIFPSISPSPSPSGQRAAYFLPSAVGTGTYPLNSEFAVEIRIWSQQEAANLFMGLLSFDPTALEVLKIDKGSTLTNWTDSSFDNSTGKISLIAGLPSPGLKTVEGNDPLMAKVTFKAKKAGSAVITMAQNSAIYSNSDNANIISGLISVPVDITP